jgi:hypothetical protein
METQWSIRDGHVVAIVRAPTPQRDEFAAERDDAAATDEIEAPQRS